MHPTRARTRWRRGALAIALAAAFAAPLAGCGSDDGASPSASTSDTAGATDAPAWAARDWILQPDGTSIPLAEGADVVLRLDGAEVSGSSGCNRYTAEAEVEGASLALGTIASTSMACADPAVNETEAAFLAALQEVDEVALDGDRLVLSGGPVTLAFAELPAVPAPSPDVLDGAWRVDTIVLGEDGDEAGVSSVIAGTEPLLTFATDGTFEAEPGCGRLSGTWTLDGDALTLTPGDATTAACPGVDGAQAQHDTIVAALGRVAEVQVLRAGVDPGDADDALVFVDAEGDLVLGLTRRA